MKTSIYPLLFEPVYKDYIWGGSRIAEIYNRRTNLNTVAESWEISDRPEGTSIISNGPLKGTTLSGLINDSRKEIIGNRYSAKNFPHLIKLIDASKRLSVQVHPNNITARKYGGEAKTEMWYILQGTPEARVYAGLQPGTTAESFRNALENESLEDVLVSIPVKQNDIIFIPGGRVHAIAEGCLLLEVQQNSNTTYRVYDWARVGKDGKPRELHVEKAFQVINWNDNESALVQPGPPKETDSAVYTKILKCDYFKLNRIDLKTSEQLDLDGSTYNALFTLSGKMRATCNSVSIELSPGTSCLIPAAAGSYRLDPTENNTSAIITSM